MTRHVARSGARGQVTPADRRLMRHMPLTLLFQRMTGQPDRYMRDAPQVHRLLRAGLITFSYDADANALTLCVSTSGRERIASAFVLPPEAP